MNLAHRWLCKSQRWKDTVDRFIFPWVVDGIDVGRDGLEIGPGPGVTTQILSRRLQNLTCVEIDEKLATSLRKRTAGQNVTVIHGDATKMAFPAASFDSAFSFTMLHHVPSDALQDRLFSEVARVLRPGGVFVGTDSLYSRGFRALHLFDTMVVVSPETLPQRLEAAGFSDVQVDVNQYAFRFRARAAKP